MDVHADIKEFLTTRRARLTPADVGLPDYGARRVPGLRREEVAVLAGVSVPYYSRLERGELGGVSESVLSALADALRLDDAERTHLFDLARAAQADIVRTPPRRRPAKRPARPDLQWLVDSITGSAVLVTNERQDVLATNALGRALYSDVFDSSERSPNLARYVFLDPRSRSFFRDWDVAAGQGAAMLRIAAGRDPYDRELSDLVGELSTRSDDFRTRWAAHNVRFHNRVGKTLHHRTVGDLDLSFTRLAAPGHGDGPAARVGDRFGLFRQAARRAA